MTEHKLRTLPGWELCCHTRGAAALPLRRTEKALAPIASEYRPIRALAVALAAAAACLALAAPAGAATITVTTTADDDTSGDGSVSLREAIGAINSGGSSDSDITAQSPGTYGSNDAIHFNIPGSGVQIIDVGSPSATALPQLQQAVTIDGTTQPGSGAVRVVLDGSAVSSSSAAGLAATARVTIRGLAIGHFKGSGVNLDEFCPVPFFCVGSDDSTIESNYIGTDAGGNVAKPNGTGVLVITTGNTIRNNVISGNGSGGGIRLTGVANFVQGNRVGTNAAGTSALPNTTSPAGGAVTATSPDNVIGGTKAANRNLISGNSGHGVLIDIGRTSVQGNFIGTDITGTHAIPNGGDGIHLTGGQQTISGQPSAPQRIWVNNGFGIHNQGDQTRFIANSIRGDKLGGIAVGGSPATGSLSIASDRKTVKVKFGNATHGGLMDIEVFDNPGRRACPGQGQVFVGGATVGSSSAGTGSATLVLGSPLKPGDGVTATLTDSAKGTSPFVCLPGGVPVPNNFSFTLKADSKGKITVKIKSPVGGSYKAKATTKVGGQKISYGKGSTSIGHAGKTKITIKPSKAAKDALNGGATLKVSVAVTFKPTGGTPKTQTKTVSVG